MGAGRREIPGHLRVDLHFTDHDETWTMWVRRGVLNARRGAHPDTPLTVSGPKAALVATLLKPASAPPLAQAGKITLDGDETVLPTFAGLLDDFDPDFDPDFAMVTP
ncbi:alkyl sulfatase C-terminal domain-containing protein [Streptomyces sp. NPDC058486]|uniref:alkyl sulfatase C-terminal domain-containing protein n=1 Tax=unclassified Streptomyces TaxID=2593676 RepID=UPI00365A859F